VSGAVVLEVPSQDTSVIKPNQDCGDRHTREYQKSALDYIQLPCESLQKAIELKRLVSLVFLFFLRTVTFNKKDTMEEESTETSMHENNEPSTRDDPVLSSSVLYENVGEPQVGNYPF
jgi:hypothetical protein